MTDRITTGFSLPATNPNPKNKVRKRKGKLPNKESQIKSPSTFTDVLMTCFGSVNIEEEAQKLKKELCWKDVLKIPTLYFYKKRFGNT